MTQKSYCEKTICSHLSWTQSYVLEVTHPRNIFRQIIPFHNVCHKTNIKLFLLVDTLHLFRYFKNYFKAVLPVPAKHSVNRWNKHGIDRCS